MRIFFITSLMLLTSPALRAEDSCESVDDMMLNVEKYEKNIQNSEKDIEKIFGDFSESDFTKLKDQFKAAQDEMAAFKDLKDNLQLFQLSSELYTKELLGLEPLLCLPYQPRVKYGPCAGDETNGVGWTVIQRRINDNVTFDRSKDKFTRGFGKSFGSFFIGLDFIWRRTNQRPHQLLIKLENNKGERRYATYSSFKIEYFIPPWFGKDKIFRLVNLGLYSGTAGEALSNALGNDFNWNEGWWVSPKTFSGRDSNLNAQPSKWDKWPTFLNSVEMMIRPQPNVK